ncbi:glycosyltransferase family 2 protein [Limimaricola pyoseonensis]|uniref:Glycosyltransferase, catalytic subunit of cellulose synthase and poly-beta-1,6-N-acetylglucosamine synthase n=1 Tax=Limimaricola pyoseonensis TaxID=521013 RepID=A0A1G7D5I6_9RHOB|nr:glycosyltransferase family 2 protein [Limimaricola pyoseonensis]SDE46789.1 Glycosyltransferase, catalytic subunit of cellulose synthase and poly-beta-1,6-N-acetylglucosamine synthase [Limimaricola pyoseonensis]
MRAGNRSESSGRPDPLVCPLTCPPDPRLVRRLGARACLAAGLLPWRRAGGTTVILCAGPPDAAARALVAPLRPCHWAPCDAATIETALRPYLDPARILRAETRTAWGHSARALDPRLARGVAAALALVGTLTVILAPGPALTLLAALCALCLLMNAGLKAAAALATLRGGPARTELPAVPPEQLPLVTLLVPLHREERVAERLLVRLGRLDYPRDRLELRLAVEARDTTTLEALAQIALPHWARVVEVPEGRIRTKPRALNFALEGARGTIVAVYDAEDAPAPDQLLRVAARFAHADPRLACLQGVLDFYNPRSNWIARCFTLEYAMWFRVMLPGLQRLGLVLPLGGTTLFLRRHVIEEVGGWDAHNVTEDADLGIRLARRGYRTEVIDTVTREEANARLWPWVRQRSRWLKGYAMCWGVAMRDPGRLWRELGAKRCLGLQLLFLGTLAQFALAPMLWSFWLLTFGLPHPAAPWLPPGTGLALVGLFLGAEMVTLAVAALGAARAGRPKLALWALALQVYFPLATLAFWRAMFELLLRPFHWDKTRHGVFGPERPDRVTPPPRPSPHRASAG